MTTYANESAMVENEAAPSRHGGSHALLAFACGALTGVALGVLFAPARGHETRRRIASTARERSDQAARLVDRSRRAVKHQKDRVDGYIEQTRTRAAEVKTEVTGAIESAKSAFDRARADSASR